MGMVEANAGHLFLEQMVTIGTATTAAVIVEAKAVAEVIGAAGTEDTVL